MSFWDEYESGRASPKGPYLREGSSARIAKGALAGAARRTAQNDLRGVCELCGFASDDVLLGICAECAKET